MLTPTLFVLALALAIILGWLATWGVNHRNDWYLYPWPLSTISLAAFYLYGYTFILRFVWAYLFDLKSWGVMTPEQHKARAHEVMMELVRTEGVDGMEEEIEEVWSERK